ARNSPQTSVSLRQVSPLQALSRSGRLMVTYATGPFVSHRTFRRASPACSLERLDQLQERAVRVLEATKLAPGFGAKPNDHRLGDELDATRLEPLILLVEVFREQRYPGNPGVVQVGIGSACGLGLLPLDQIEAGRAGVVT